MAPWSATTPMGRVILEALSGEMIDTTKALSGEVAMMKVGT